MIGTLVKRLRLCGVSIVPIHNGLIPTGFYVAEARPDGVEVLDGPHASEAAAIVAAQRIVGEIERERRV
jgi:hypothetical protein